MIINSVRMRSFRELKMANKIQFYNIEPLTDASIIGVSVCCVCSEAESTASNEFGHQIGLIDLMWVINYGCVYVAQIATAFAVGTRGVTVLRCCWWPNAGAAARGRFSLAVGKKMHRFCFLLLIIIQYSGRSHRKIPFCQIQTVNLMSKCWQLAMQISGSMKSIKSIFKSISMLAHPTCATLSIELQDSWISWSWHKRQISIRNNGNKWIGQHTECVLCVCVLMMPENESFVAFMCQFGMYMMLHRVRCPQL